MAGQKRKSPETKDSESTVTVSVPPISLIKSSEEAFPRGGASALTPLEVKEVGNQAARDVLFETNNNKDDSPHKNKRQKTEKKKSKNSKSIDDSKDGEDKDLIPVEHLSSRNVIPGSYVLGQVIQINKLEVVLALPDNLKGYISLSNISFEVSKQIENYEDSSDSEKEDEELNEDEEVNEEEEEEEEGEKEFPESKKLVKIGQWLRALVIEPTQRESSSKKNPKKNKRIELSVDPSLVNDNLEDDDLVIGQTIQASVKSVEDHGLVLNIGKHELSGFITKKDVQKSGYKLDDIAEGAIFLTIISKKLSNSRVVNVQIANVSHNAITKISSVDAVIPGNIVEAIINTVSEKGVSAKVFGTINASINLPNINIYSLSSLKDRFEIGGKFKAKVVASIISGSERKLLLTLLPHILNFRKQDDFDPLEAFPVGFTIDELTITANDGQYFYGKFGNNDSLPSCQIHNSRVPEKKLHFAKYYEGSVHKAKIIDFSPIENQYILSLEQNVIDQKFIRPQDIPIGQYFNDAIIESVSGSEGITLKVFDKFEVKVLPNHISDIKLIYPERKFKVGSKIKGRILKVSSGNKIFATLKKSLVNNLTNDPNDDSKNLLVNDVSTVKVGTRTSGTVEVIYAHGALISFFGNCKGYLPKSEISETFVKHPQDFLKVGQTVMVGIISVDVENDRMSLTCKAKSDDKDFTEKHESDVKESGKTLKSLKTGKSIVQAVILEKNKDNIVLDLIDYDCRGVITTASQLSDANYEQNRQLFKSLKIGSKLECLVIDKDKKSELAILSGKQSLIEDSKSSRLPVEFEDIEKLKDSKEKIHGYIKSITDRGLFIGFGGRLVGLVLKKYALKNKLDDLSSHYKLYQTIDCHVLNIDTENKRFLLALKDEEISKNVKKGSLTDNDFGYKLEVGEIVPGKIKAVHPNYLLVQLVQKKFGFCYVTDALDDYDEELAKHYRLGNKVQAKILSVDEVTKRYHVSLRDSAKKDVVDREIRSVDDLKVGDVVRGFIKNVNDKGIYVSFNSNLFGLVRVSDISDQFIKNWKNYFKPNQVVKSRVLSIKGEGRILLTLKQSQLTGDLNLLKNFDDLQVGDIFDGSVRNVTEFGVFVNLDGTNNISGLCHKTQVSDDGTVDNLSALFGEGDKVKVKLLSIDKKKKQLSLSMKASHFADDEDESDAEMKVEKVDYVGSSDEENEGEDEQMNDQFDNEDSDNGQEAENSEKEDEPDLGLSANGLSVTNGLSTNGFDWTASILDQVNSSDDEEENDYDNEFREKSSDNFKKKKSVVSDKTGELNVKAPQSVADFERLLIGEPNSSVLWMNYMSFELQLNETEKAREIGQRALKTINYREEQEKLNIWIALLNLENYFGNESTLNETFKKACQHMDSLVVHEKLVGIYILSGKLDDAEDLFRVMIKKFSKEIKVWVNFGKFYLENKNFEKTQELLTKALQVLPKSLHVELVKKFGMLEFKLGSAEKARGLFEGLISDKPKKLDLWNIYIDQEIKFGSKDKVEEVFERLVVKKLNNKQKKFFFTKWLNYEESMNDEKYCDYVKAKAKEIASN